MRYIVVLKENWNRGEGILIPRRYVKVEIDADSKEEAVSKALLEKNKNSPWRYTLAYVED